MSCSCLKPASLLLLAGALTLAAPAARGQSLVGHPFRTLPPFPLESGTQIIEVGLEHRTDVVPQPLLSDTRGDLTRAPELRYRLGFGRAEVAVAWPAIQSFSPDDKVLDDESEVGDVSLWLTVAARKPRRGGLGLGFAVGAKWPNASDESGLGTDEADVFLAVLLGQQHRRHEWRLNLGVAVLGDPSTSSSQEDLLTYGFAALHGRRHRLAWEVQGRVGTGDDQDHLDEGTAGLGYVFAGDRLTLDVALLVGLEDNSGDLGLSAGLGWAFGSPTR